MRIELVVAVALLSIPFCSTAAQELTGIREGQRVRITSSSSKDLRGVIRQARVDSIVIYTEPSGAALSIATSDLRRIDVSSGRTSGEGAKRGAIWGEAIGAALGLLGAMIVASDDSDYPGSPPAGEFLAQSIGGGLLWGAGIGALVKAEKWERVSIRPRVRISSVGLSIALR